MGIGIGNGNGIEGDRAGTCMGCGLRECIKFFLKEGDNGARAREAGKVKWENGMGDGRWETNGSEAGFTSREFGRERRRQQAEYECSDARTPNAERRTTINGQRALSHVLGHLIVEAAASADDIHHPYPFHFHSHLHRRRGTYPPSSAATSSRTDPPLDHRTSSASAAGAIPAIGPVRASLPFDDEVVVGVMRGALHHPAYAVAGNGRRTCSTRRRYEVQVEVGASGNASRPDDDHDVGRVRASVSVNRVESAHEQEGCHRGTVSG